MILNCKMQKKVILSLLKLKLELTIVKNKIKMRISLGKAQVGTLIIHRVRFQGATKKQIVCLIKAPLHFERLHFVLDVALGTLHRFDAKHVFLLSGSIFERKG